MTGRELMKYILDNELENEKIEVMMPKKTNSKFARFFDEFSQYHTSDPKFNLIFLLEQQRYANDKLRARGFLFLNDVERLLGIPESIEGKYVGWVYKDDSTYVDFGIFNSDERSRAFINGDERSILLDFNVQGYMWAHVHRGE